MKAQLYIIAAFVFFSCNNDQLEQCKSENELLRSEKNRRDSAIHSITNTYSEIDSVSLIVSIKKGHINELAKKSPLTKDDKTEILAEMDTINLLLAENKSSVSNLQSNMGNTGLEEGFRYMVQSMEEKNLNEDEDLGKMKSNLAQISKDFSDLFEDYVYKEVENMEIRDQLSTKEAELLAAQEKLSQAHEKLQSGWYVIGTKDELKEKGLIYKKGIFDIKEVNKDFDRNVFKKVDIYDFDEILLDTKYAEIMTTHPSESFEVKGIKKKVDKLVINNPELFWSVSKFLIIEIEN